MISDRKLYPCAAYRRDQKGDTMTVTQDIRYIGVNDHAIDLFEGQYRVPSGMSYNSYVILDEKIAVMDTVDARFTHEWLDNLQSVLGGRSPDYHVISDMRSKYGL